MKCPACKNKLYLINPPQSGEYVCANEDCQANIDVGDNSISWEFYGCTQKEINSNYEKTRKSP